MQITAALLIRAIVILIFAGELLVINICSYKLQHVDTMEMSTGAVASLIHPVRTEWVKQVEFEEVTPGDKIAFYTGNSDGMHLEIREVEEIDNDNRAFVIEGTEPGEIEPMEYSNILGIHKEPVLGSLFKPVLQKQGMFVSCILVIILGFFRIFLSSLEVNSAEAET